MRTREWAALWVVMATATASSLAFGEDPTPCYEVYLTVGPAQEQMSFEEFRELYSDDVCATSGTE